MPFQTEIMMKDCTSQKSEVRSEVRIEESYTQNKDGTIITMPYDKDTAPHFKYGLGYYI